MKRIFFLLSLLFVFAGANAIPVVNAGNDTTLTVSPGSATDTGYLSGKVSGTSGSVSYSWTKITGTGSSILFSSFKTTPVIGLTPGVGSAVVTYTFRLTVTDATGSASDDVVFSIRNCTAQAPITLTSSGSGVTVDGGSFVPGTIFQIDSASGPFIPYVSMYNIKGAPGCPVVLRNTGFLDMGNGFDVRSTQYFKISGKGPRGAGGTINPQKTSDTFGIRVKGHWKETISGVFQTYANSGANGLELHEDNLGFEMENIDISRTKYGMQIKNNEDCDTLKDFPLSRGIYNTSLHNLWVHYTESQGMYIGSTGAHNYHSMDRGAPTCGGYPNPARLGVLEIFNNWIDSTGRSNYQVALASYGYSYVHDNHGWWSGGQKDDAQGGNLTDGAYTNMIAKSNDFQHAYTWNIINYGSSLYAYDNTIRYGGYAVHTMTSQTAVAPDTLIQTDYGSAIHNRASQTERMDMTIDSTIVWLKNNTISNARYMDITDPNQYVVTYYSSAAPSPQTLIPWLGGSGIWSYDNRTQNNTYNGAFRSGTTTPYFTVSHTPPIHVAEIATPYIPWISAGIDIYTYENIAILDGFAQGINGNTISSVAWTQVSGPNTATIVSPTTLWSPVTGLIGGVYKFKLTVTDNVGTVMTDDVFISSSNVYPAVNAGGDITITLPTSQVTLSGSSSDADGTIIEHNWYLKSATNPSFWLVPTFGPDNGNQYKRMSSPTIQNFSEAGVYTFRHTAYDNTFLSKSDDVVVTVLPSGSNISPTVNAGGDITITLPTNFASLTSTAADADGSVVSYSWTKVSGPSGGAISTPSVATTSITSMIQGTYTYRITVTDNNGASTSDDVVIFVNAIGSGYIRTYTNSIRFRKLPIL